MIKEREIYSTKFYHDGKSEQLPPDCSLKPIVKFKNIIYTILVTGPPAQSLGVEPVDHEVLKRKPRDTSRRIISRAVLLSVLLSAAIIIAGTLWVFNREVNF